MVYECASKETWNFAMGPSGRPNDPKDRKRNFGRPLRLRTTCGMEELKFLWEPKGAQPSTVRTLSLPLSSTPHGIRHPRFLQATALCKFTYGKLVRKRGTGEKRGEIVKE